MRSWNHRISDRWLSQCFLPAFHIPNPILMGATFAGGFVFAEIFFRHPNIWPLAFVQAVAGFLIGALSPPALIHSMRVGPGYFFFHLH